MTDIELLELAAKSVGLNIKAHSVDVDDNFQALIVGKKGTREKVIWSPLADDGDALRLAVGLKLSVSVFHDYTDCTVLSEPVIEIHNNDAARATRRAIVRAAAEIGASK